MGNRRTAVVLAAASFALASTTRDSNFSGDTYANGNNLNNRVFGMQNRFNSTSVRGFKFSNYNTALTACIGPGISVGPLPVNVSDGMSSFRSC